ncbi:MAG: large repetitive protein, partial [Microbacteriaceae bacterium]|nr:large repetitive protein [Microbacteriaceae bacterium]
MNPQHSILRRSLRHPSRVVAVTLAVVLSFTVLLAAPLSAFAAPAPPSILSPESPYGTTENFLSVSGSVGESADQTITVFIQSAALPSQGVCSTQLSVSDEEWSCIVTLPSGQYGVYTVTATSYAVGGSLADDSAPSAGLTVNYGSTADAVISTPPDGASAQGLSVDIVGTGPALGAIEMMAVPLMGEDQATVCSDVVVSAAGAWSCTATFPDYDRYELHAVGTTAADTSVGDSLAQTFDARPPKPSATIDSSVGSNVATVTGETTGATTAAWNFNPADESFLPPLYCPGGWDGSFDNGQPEGATSPLSCDPGAAPAGVHELSSTQWGNAAYSSTRSDLLMVPNTPVIDTAIPFGDNTVFVGGNVAGLAVNPWAEATVNSGSTVHVVDTTSEAPVPVCDADADVNGNWSCSGLSQYGTRHFNAYAVSTGFGDNASVAGSVDGYHDGASVYSEDAQVTVTSGVLPPVLVAPTSGQTMTPGTTFSGTLANPDGLASTVYVEYYQDDPDVVSEFCEAPVDAEGGWTCDSTLAYGTSTVVAVAKQDAFPNFVSQESNHRIVTLGGTQDSNVTTPYDPGEGDPEVFTSHTPVFYGTGPSLGTVQVLVEGLPACSAVVTAAGDWSCQSIELKSGHFSVTTTNTRLDETSGTPSEPRAFGVRPDPPSLAYTFGPASILATATADANGAAGVELYLATPNGEGGYSFGDPVTGCPPLVHTGEGFTFQYGDQVQSCTFGSLAP